jgi:tetratricopeptide (TPR) repeat protein
VPGGLDLGEIRYNLGFLYWKQYDWNRCLKVLTPFVDDATLAKSRSRAKALYMAAQSAFRTYDPKGGLRIVRVLIRDHPNFEAIEEAYVYAARGCVENAEWPEFEHLYRRFMEAWPQSASRPHMDLYSALAMIGQGKVDAGMGKLKSLAGADTLEDVKADAYYHLGRLILADEKTPNVAEALKYLEMSVNLYPREAAFLAAAKAAMQLKQWDKARAMLNRLLRDFPAGDPKALAEAKALLPDVMKQISAKG